MEDGLLSIVTDAPELVEKIRKGVRRILETFS